ncbi:MAG: polysaccharide biosynthesis tyrosine autokinase [Nonlabens sp.]|uniref:exopolysaccharide transport family protein n=1 Tax=Nonlabens sp. TaxID=1888209 RepID=UPI00321B1AF9
MEEEYREVNSLSDIFDVQQFFFKLLSLWWFLLLVLGIGLGYAYYKNQFIQTYYDMNSLISIKDNSNPLFTSNTSLTFNWGGTTDKVTTAITQFKSRSHAEQVVDKLQFYINYTKEGDYYDIDAYKQTPFFIYADSDKAQILEKPLRIKVLSDKSFELSADFSNDTASAFNYATKQNKTVTTPQGEWKKVYNFGESIQTSFFNATVERRTATVATGEWLIEFGNYWDVVNNYKDIAISQKPEGSSIIELSLRGNNKQRLIDYINSSTIVLETDELERKNKYAVSTIKYIDSSLVAQADAIKQSEQELQDFRSSSKIVDISEQNTGFNEKLSNYEIQRTDLQNKQDYYNNLRNYLLTRTDYSTIQAPTVVGINESNILASVTRLISLSEERKRREFSMRPDAPVFADIDRDINAVKDVIFENIASSKVQLDRELSRLNQEIYAVESEIKSLPKEQQELLKIQRQFNNKQNAYEIFLSRRAEAALIKAANVSDIYVIDAAKDTGREGQRKDSNINYLIALLVGFALPITVAFVLTLIDNFIYTPKDIEKYAKIPLIGVVGKMDHPTNLIVHDQPKSTIAESFRGIRSSLHFIYNREASHGSRTIMVTSSVSGEGKTFTSINLATVFALSGKRTVLVGMDLRKPKIFDDFEVQNDKGASNYLANDATLDEIILQTRIENMDLILSGPVPPNPSELVISPTASRLVEECKKRYDYIILDSPPLGLVADALEISKYADATLYVVRQGYTKKAMLGVINDKFQRKEIKNVSVLFNYFKERGSYGQGYGYGYGAYGNGYHENNSKKSRWSGLKNFLISLSRKRN